MPVELLIENDNPPSLKLQRIEAVLSLSLTNNAWVGAHDAGNKNQFVWIGGTSDVLPADADVWGPSEPNHGTSASARDCVMVSSINKELYTTQCGDQLSIVCEARVN